MPTDNIVRVICRTIADDDPLQREHSLRYDRLNGEFDGSRFVARRRDQNVGSGLHDWGGLLTFVFRRCGQGQRADGSAEAKQHSEDEVAVSKTGQNSGRPLRCFDDFF
jgi:hypothetical protein